MSVNDLLCPDVADPTLVERYLAGRLIKEEADRFEEHYLTCPRCQDELRLATAVRRGLRVVEGAGPGRGLSYARRRLWFWRVGAGLAVAAVLAIVLVTRGPGRAQLAALGAVSEAPFYLGVPVRAADESGGASLERGMRAYAQGHYGDAATELRTAAAQDPALAPARFFLAASLLLQDRAEDAAAEFQAVIDLGDTPYRTEAHYYLAKALLRLRHARAALAELQQAAAAEGPVAAQAIALADSVRGVLAR